MDRDGLTQQRNTSQMERNESGRWRVAEKNTSYHGHCQNRTQQQYSHKSVCAYVTVHKSSFNIRPTIFFCSLKIVLVLYKLTWIHQLVNNSSNSIDFFQKITWFVLNSKWPGWKEPNTEWIWNFTTSHYCSCKHDSSEFYDYREFMPSFVFKNNDFYDANQPVVIFLESFLKVHMALWSKIHFLWSLQDRRERHKLPIYFSEMPK